MRGLSVLLRAVSPALRAFPVVRAGHSSYSFRMKRSRAVAAAALLSVAALLAGCVTSAGGKVIAADYYNIANAFFDLGQYDKAVLYYQSALRVDPNLVKADYNLALTFVRMKRNDDAIAILKRLLANDQKNTTVMSALGWAYHQAGKDGEALTQYDILLVLSPADQSAWYNSGIILWKLERKPEALDRFRRVLALAPDDTDALFAAGSILLSTDDPQGSSEMLSRYVDKKPDDIDAWYLIAAGAERLHKYSRALEAFDKIIALDPKQGAAWFGETRLLLTVVEDPREGARRPGPGALGGLSRQGRHQGAARIVPAAGKGQGRRGPEGARSAPASRAAEAGSGAGLRRLSRRPDR